MRSVSVVIPVRNGAPHLAAAIDSVAIQPDVAEILVVDDGSTDTTPAVVQAHDDARVRYVRQEPLGASVARNLGVALARGELLAFLDADDLWLPGKIARQIAALESGAAEMIFTQVEEFVSPELDVAAAAALLPHPGRMNGVSGITMLMRRSDFLRVGEFDPELQLGEFLHWFGRAQEAGLRSMVLPEVLARRRLHAANLGRSHDGRRQQYAAILRDMLVRRRAQATDA